MRSTPIWDSHVVGIDKLLKDTIGDLGPHNSSPEETACKLLEQALSRRT